MPIKTVAHWPDEAYKQTIGTATDGQIAHTHRALIQPPGEATCRAYVKHFLQPGTHRGLFNEWFCFHVLGALGVPQPRCAVMRAPIFGTGALHWAFISCEPSPVNQGTPKEIYFQTALPDIDGLSRRLLNCPSLPALIAADQLVANDDRNLGNLVFTGKNSFVAIDHSNGLHGPGWIDGDLWRTQRPVVMKLLNFLRSTQTRLPVGFDNAVVAAAEVALESYYEHQLELRAAMGCATNRDSAAAMDMTWWRCNDLRDWLKADLGVM